MNALPNYDTWKTAAPEHDGPEPSEEMVDEAFAELVEDSQLLADFIEVEQPDFTTPFQLFHKYGLPSMDGSERDDNLRESWQVTMTNFFDHYRDWVSERLTAKADEVMHAAIQAAQDDADDYAADMREFGAAA